MAWDVIGPPTLARRDVPGHVPLLVRAGIPINENLNLGARAARVYDSRARVPAAQDARGEGLPVRSPMSVRRRAPNRLQRPRGGRAGVELAETPVWKQSDVNRAAPVGANGTRVCFPQLEQITSCIERVRPFPSVVLRAALHSGQRRGSF
jgi:hypothetical protein